MPGALSLYYTTIMYVYCYRGVIYIAHLLTDSVTVKVQLVSVNDGSIIRI